MNYKKVLETEFSGGKSIHVTRQTLNGKQQTLTGYHTTHHTTGTAFQTNQAIDTDVTNHTSLHIQTDPMENGVQNCCNYKIPKKQTIPSFPDFDDRYANSTLPDIALLRDMAWAITNSVGSMCVQKKNSNQLVLGQRS